MDLTSIVTSIQDLPLSAAMRGETERTAWLFPIIETIHIFCLAIVFGTIAMVDLRLLGWSSRNAAVTRLASETLPWTWTAWCIAAITGILMFTAKAVAYTGNFQFRMKFICMGLAAVNMLVFHMRTYKNVAAWDTAAVPPPAARIAGAISMTFWVGVIFFGRWIGFKT
jgi:hypothetical protein